MSQLYMDLPMSSFPSSVQTFVTMQDIVAADGANVKGFQDAMEAGNMALAQQYYSAITNADAKFIDATKLNTLFQTCVALQRFYQTDVQPYVTEKQAEWQDVIDTFNYVGAFDSTTQYYPNNWVSFAQVDGNVFLYICIRQPAVGTVPTNVTYWRLLTIRGQAGPSGSGLSFQGEWVNTQQYTVDDAVAYGNAVWGCTQDNVNNIPVEGSAYWQLLYSVQPQVYPVQAAQPSSQSVGDLWFKVVG